MNIEELKKLSDKELAETLLNLQQELHGLFLKARGHNLKQVHKIKIARKNIARILTLLANKAKAK